jgi:hypothetical protein
VDLIVFARVGILADNALCDRLATERQAALMGPIPAR